MGTDTGSTSHGVRQEAIGELYGDRDWVNITRGEAGGYCRALWGHTWTNITLGEAGYCIALWGHTWTNITLGGASIVELYGDTHGPTSHWVRQEAIVELYGDTHGPTSHWVKQAIV